MPDSVDGSELSEERKNPTKSNEVKSSWTTSYILLTITLSVLTGIAGYGLKYVFEPGPTRTLTIRSHVSPNLLGLDERARTGILASYKLKAVPQKELQSYFQYQISVRNAGTVGADDVKVYLENKSPDVTVIKTPALSTEPSDILAGLSLMQSKDTDANHDEWTVPFLNPGETINFTYVAYSEKYTDSVSLTGIARKKDWQTVKEGEQAVKTSSVLSKPITEFRGVDILLFLMYFLAFQMIFNVYFMFIMNLPTIRRILRRWSDQSRPRLYD